MTRWAGTAWGGPSMPQSREGQAPGLGTSSMVGEEAARAHQDGGQSLEGPPGPWFAISCLSGH